MEKKKYKAGRPRRESYEMKGEGSNYISEPMSSKFVNFNLQDNVQSFEVKKVDPKCANRG